MLVYKGKAEVIERLDKPLRSSTGSFIWPHVIRLIHYVRVPRAIQRKISRRALFARDGWRCAYCGTTAGRLTLDHVVPRSRGGESVCVWDLRVIACERDAYLRTVLGAAPSLECYLQSDFEGDA